MHYSETMTQLSKTESAICHGFAGKVGYFCKCKSVNNAYLYSVVYEGLYQVPVSAVLRGGHGVHSGGKQLILFRKTKKKITEILKNL
jgi:hypothetical protein